MKPINTAIISYGMSGKVFHAPLITSHPGFHLHTIMQRSSESSKHDYPGVKVVKSLEDIANDPAIELVVVNTPNPTHHKFTKMMLEAGKHVIVEKPFTNTVAEAENLISIANKNDRLISVFQNRRWDGDFMTVKKVIQEKLCGELVEFECHYDRFRNYVEENTWKEEEAPGAGILYNLGSHMLDQVITLFGVPKNVYADIRTQRIGGQVADNYEVICDYGYLKATAKSSYLVREQGPRYQVYGQQGTFLKYGIDPQEQALKEGYTPEMPGWGVEDRQDWGFINTEMNGLHFEGRIETLPGAYQDYYENIFQAIRNGESLAVTAKQATDVIRVIEAAIQSNQEKRMVEVR
ncbi:MAG: oxidoreductase [Cyclobacteriaceae bacterium]